MSDSEKAGEQEFQNAVMDQHTEAQPIFARSRKDTLRARIEHDFKYHPPRPEQIAVYTELRERAKDLALHLVDVVPEGRELSTALTLLEQAVMEANAGIARHG